MKTGRKPKPAALKRLHGTFNVTRDGNRGPEPLAPGVLLDPPDYLSPAQALRFQEILAEAPANLLRRWDAPTLAGFVIAESAVIEANKARQADASPFALSSHGVVVLSAALKLQARYLPLMKSFGELLGFSPAARAGMKIENSSPDPDDKRWEEFDRITRRIEGKAPLSAAERRRNLADDRRHKRVIAELRREQEERRAKEAAELEAAKQAAGNVIDLQTPPPGLAKATNSRE